MTSRLFADVSTCAQCAALFPRTAEACVALAHAARERAATALDRIRALDPGARTFVNTADAMDVAAAELDVSGSVLAVVSHVSPHKEVRDEAARQLVALESFEIDNIQYDRRLYDALKTTTTNAGYAVDCDECAYWMRETLDDYRRRGLELPQETFDQVVALRKSLAALCTTFSQNISEDATTLYFDADELAGTPDNVLASLQRKHVDDSDNKNSGDDKEDKKEGAGAGAYIVKLDYPTYFGIMRSCHVAATRRRVARAFCNRAYDTNRDVLKEMIGKRHELARLLGYASYAHLSLADKMAKSPEVAQAFVEDLVPRLQAKWAEEAKLLKAHLHPSCVLTADKGELEDYDIPFAINHYKQTQLHVDENVIQEYFPMTTTVQALFDIYQAFFDITFTHIENGKELWHPTANTLAVHDKRDGKLLGHIILDLFPREGKYSHACCHSVVPPARVHVGGADGDGSHGSHDYSPALAVVLANFPAPVGERPALFRHDDVQTFFHEFGHAIHGLMGRTRMATFAGTRVKRDFVELPSQMLEEWLWQRDILRRVSRHYRTQQPMPDDLIDAKVRSRNVFSGRDSLRQLQFATYSLAIFGIPFAATPAKQLDTTALWQAIEPRVLPGVHYEADAHFECSFGHLTGYGAGYYGYMWSKVFALDLFDYILTHDGLLDPHVGRRYIDCIIGVGGGQDPNDMLRNFLGRPPQSDAFLRSVGVA